MSGYHTEDICAYCGFVIEGRGYRCGKGIVHEDCLNEMKEPGDLLNFLMDNRDDLEAFLTDHLSDDFMDEFWETLRREFEVEIERWATS